MRTNWSTVAVGDFLALNYGKALKSENRVGGDVPVYGSGGLVGNHNSSLIEVPTIIVGRKGSIGSLKFEESPSWPIDTTYFVSLRDGSVDLKWVYYLLANLGLSDMNKSAAVPGLNRDDVYRLRVSLPPLDEQRRIAAVLDHVDALRAKRHESVKELTGLPESVFRSMFTQNVDRSWCRMRVNDLLAERKNAIRTGPFGSQLLKEEFTESGIPVLGIDNVVTNEFRWGERRYISSSKYEQLKRYTVLPGDVLITIMGTNGRVAVVPDDIPTAINTKHLCCMTLDQQLCLPEYLRAVFLWHPDSRRYLGATAKGAIMAGLNMGIIKGLPVTIPPVSLQRRFVARLTKIEVARTQAEQHLRELDNLFASLQSRALAGELDVSKVVLPSS